MQFTVFTASTAHDSEIINTSTYKQELSISLELETFENLNGFMMKESVYSGCDTKF